MAGERILFVDDEEPIRKLIGTYLTKVGYRVSFAADGMDALRAIGEQGNPDLVLTDVNMPNMTGLELTRRLRGHHRTQRIPIMMLSALKQAEDMLAGFAEGADDYIPKPIELSVLAAKIESLLRRYSVTHADGGGQPGQVIMFLHGKGGVGATTLAVNSAVALSVAPRRVALLDLNLEFPNCGVFMNVRPQYTLADLAAIGPANLTDETFAPFVASAPADVGLVVGSDVPERAELVTVPAVQATLDLLRARHDCVVVDAPANFSERNLTALDAASVVCVVSGLTVPALKASLDCLQVLDKLNFPAERTVLVANKTTPAGVSVEQATQFFGRRPDVLVGYSELFDHAANAGAPLVLSHPDYSGARELRQLAGSLMQRADPGP